MNKTPVVAVVGSLNMDLVVRLERLPTPGETLLGSDCQFYPGGKGANQAVAAARAGAQVIMSGCVGSDIFGNQLRTNLDRNGIDTHLIQTLPGSSGIALISVDAEGQNMIVVSPGANRRFPSDPLPPLEGVALIMMQLEIPLEVVELVATWANQVGIPVLLNPAPIQPLADELFNRIRYLVLNQSEAAELTGLASETGSEALVVAHHLHKQGVETVIITLGGSGLVWVSGEGEGHLPAHEVDVVDTTAAGDGFCGALAARLVAGDPLEAALRFANGAAALAVMRVGAQPSLATLAEIEQFLAEKP